MEIISVGSRQGNKYAYIGSIVWYIYGMEAHTPPKCCIININSDDKPPWSSKFGNWPGLEIEYKTNDEERKNNGKQSLSFAAMFPRNLYNVLR